MTNKRILTLAFVLASLLLLPSAHAYQVRPRRGPPPVEKKPPPPPPPKLYLGLNAGGLFSSFSELGASPLVGARAGYILPFRASQFVVALDGGYAAPGAAGSRFDTRLNRSGSAYDWNLTVRQGFLGVLFLHRATWLGSERLVPFAGIGPRLWFLQSRVTAKTATSDILLSTEQSTQLGFLLPIGVEFKLGPGALTAELQLSYAPVDSAILGNTSVGARSLAIGYRIITL